MTLADLIRQYEAQQMARAGADKRYAPTIGQGAAQNLGTAVTNFKNLYRNLIGAEAGEEELNQFYSSVLSSPENLQVGAHEARTQGELRDISTQFINDTFQRQAEQQAQLELQNQQGEANRLADLYRTQGRQSISDTASRLQDYQTRLFEKLRPQLITSRQTQGLLNTGGLNEAMAGAAGDLAAAGQEELRGHELANEQAANQIAFGGASAPYEFQRQQSMNRLGNLNQMGQTAQQQAYNTAMQQMAFNNQVRLAEFNSRGSSPSLLKQMGGQILGNIASTFVPGVGGMVGRQMYGQTGAPTPGPSTASNLNLLQGSGYPRYA